MSKQAFSIDSANLAAARSYIRQQFAQKSWWPTQGPQQAKEEFERLPETPEALAVWCEKWLDGGQRRQLRIAVQKAPPGAIG
jgi:hypothetical protein